MRKEFSSESISRCLFYEQYYEILSHIELLPGERKYMGSRENRTCRYCAKSSPATTFRKVAHTFPEFIGNKTLISYDECDACNDKFSNTIDVHLARSLGIESTIAQIPGKRGIPTYKVPGKAPRLEYSVEENMLKADAHSADGFIEIAENEKRVTIHAYRQPYRKRSAYKCLVKMALAIMPEHELHNFGHTLDWINIHNPEDDTLETNTLLCLRSRSPISLRAIDALLLRHKDPNAPIPYVTFFITFYNFSFQVFLPLSTKDQYLAGQTVQICHFPTKMEYFSDVTYFSENLSSNELGRGEKDLLSLSYDGEITKTIVEFSADK